jgi:hypothetical protein
MTVYWKLFRLNAIDSPTIVEVRSRRVQAASGDEMAIQGQNLKPNHGGKSKMTNKFC